ncbi:MAG: glycoside hydrolase family 127 protein, partial [Planctomycetota bacterium]
MKSGSIEVRPNISKPSVIIFLLFSVFFLSQLSVLQADTLKTVPVTAVHIQDNFWTPKLEVYRKNTIPHSLEYVKNNIQALRKLAGLSEESGKTGKWTEANLHKYIETCAYSLALHPDAKLEKELDEIISALSAAQRPDGYIHAHITLNNLTPWGDLYHQHDGYVLGHMYEAAVAHYQVTGKRKMLDVARRSADQAYRYFIEENKPGFPGHAEIELALVQLYRATREKRYIELSKSFIERRGQNPGKECPRYPCEYFQDHLPVYEQKEIKGHAVRAVFLATGVADAAMETGDVRLYEVARALWRNVTGRKMYITGSIGASRKHEAFGEDYYLPNNGYCESCAACGLADFAHRMLMIEADGRCGDVLERVLYNAILHGIS